MLFIVSKDNKYIWPCAFSVFGSNPTLKYAYLEVNKTLERKFEAHSWKRQERDVWEISVRETRFQV